MRATLASLVDDFRAHANETAVVEHRGNRRYATSYGELAQLAGRFAAELERRDIKPGERVVLWGANSAEWIGVFFGCLLRGVLVVPLDAAGSAEFAARVVAETTPKLLVGDAELLETLSVVRSTFSVEGADVQRRTYNVERLPLDSIAEHLPHEPLYTVPEAVTAQTPFQIVFTSGTTSEPRGIVHTHRNVLVTLAPIESEIEKYRKFERPFHPLRFLHSLPLSHVFGQFMGLWIPAVLAAEVHFAEQLDPSRLTALIRRERISVLIAVPRVLHLLRAHLVAEFPELTAELKQPPPKGTLGILKKWWRFRKVHRALGWKFWAVISGGATLPPDIEAFWGELGYALIQGYGMTETAALVTLNHPFHISRGTIGKPLPGREVKITDEGEILVRGEMLASATWQGGRMRQREGEWLATGDLAERGAGGELKFLGRKGDVIVTAAGLNIHPADLEAALAKQPGVRAAAVVACDFSSGPEPVAVVLTGLDEAGLQAAVDAANRELAEFQQMRRVLRWPEPQLPYTSTGKLVRRRVAEWACAQFGGGIPPKRSLDGAPGVGGDSLLRLIAEVTGEAVAQAEDADRLRLSEDLHLDSLGRVQLQSALEQRFVIGVDDDAMAAVATVEELRAVISGQLSVVSERHGDSGAKLQNDADENTSPASQLTTDHWQLTTHEEQIYPRWPWSWPVRMVRDAFVELVVRPLVWVLAKPRVRYVDPTHRDEAAMNGAPGTFLHNGERRSDNGQLPTPCLIIANHITAYDGALVLYALPGAVRRRVAAAMSGEMLMDFRKARNQGNWALNLMAPAAYWLITALFNVFPLPRARGFRRSFAHAGEAMDEGYNVLIFPEGTRSKTGHIGAFRQGIGLLAQESRVPVVPVALVGLYEYSEPVDGRKRPRWFHAGRLEVRVGRPIPVAEQAADAAELTAQLEDALWQLL